MNLDEVLGYFGTQSALAEVLGVDRAAVAQWKIDGLPPARAIQIEALTDGAFKAVDIVGLKSKKANNDGK